MNLGLCISNLLRRYPTVHVPGIGVFKITRIPASYDRERSVILPPASVIELTGGHGDSLPIVSYLRAQLGVDEDAALHMLDEAIRDLAETINKNGRALLDGLGYLVADGASFVFKPFDRSGITISPVAIPPEVVNEVVPTPENGAEYETGAVTSPPARRASRWIAVAAVVLLLSGAGVVWYYKSGWLTGGKEDPFLVQKNESEAPVDEGGAPPVATSPIDTAAADSVISQLSAQAADSVQVDTAVVVSNPPKPAITYEIVVGSFATMAQARKYVAKMKAKGYDLRALDSRMPGNRK